MRKTGKQPSETLDDYLERIIREEAEKIKVEDTSEAGVEA